MKNPRSFIENFVLVAKKIVLCAVLHSIAGFVQIWLKYLASEPAFSAISTVPRTITID